MRSFASVLATAFGLGFVPLAPGTAASAAAAAAYGLVLHRLSWPLYALVILIVLAGGRAVAERYAAELGRSDPGCIVVDEVCGQLVALAFLPAGWLPIVLAFALFRFFDIIKPGPIRSLERLAGGWGIMADDIGAGVVAALLTRVILLLV